jgi:proteic killer suppression protein
VAIQSFKCNDTKELYETGKSKRFGNIKAAAERKLQMLDSAVTLDFLKAPPANRLEALTRARAGQHSIRINDQWRVCFVWTAEEPQSVEIVDYH